MKKRNFFVLGMLVMVLAFGMAVIGCDDDNGGDNGSGSSFMGATLNLSGQVWTRDWDENDNPKYELFTGNRAGISGVGYHDGDEVNIGGSGSISNGQLSFSITTPLETANLQGWYWGESFNNFNFSPSNARFAELYTLNISGSENDNELSKSFGNDNTSESVEYVYVDRDVTITGSGKTTTHACDCEDYDDQCYCGSDCNCGGTSISRNLNLNFKAGWNIITIKNEYNESNQSQTMSIFAGDSSRSRWVLDEWNNYNMNIQVFIENVIPNNNARSLLRSKH